MLSVRVDKKSLITPNGPNPRFATLFKNPDFEVTIIFGVIATAHRQSTPNNPALSCQNLSEIVEDSNWIFFVVVVCHLATFSDSTKEVTDAHSIR